MENIFFSVAVKTELFLLSCCCSASVSPPTGLLTKTLKECQSSQGDPVQAHRRRQIRELCPDTRSGVAAMSEHGGRDQRSGWESLNWIPANSSLQYVWHRRRCSPCQTGSTGLCARRLHQPLTLLVRRKELIPAKTATNNKGNEQH